MERERENEERGRDQSDFNSGRKPDLTEIRSLFVDGLQISDATAFRKEIDFLEGQICRREEDIDEIDLSLLHSVVALSHFARFSLLSFNPESEKSKHSENSIRSIIFIFVDRSSEGFLLSDFSGPDG